MVFFSVVDFCRYFQRHCLEQTKQQKRHLVLYVVGLHFQLFLTPQLRRYVCVATFYCFLCFEIVLFHFLSVIFLLKMRQHLERFFLGKGK